MSTLVRVASDTASDNGTVITAVLLGTAGIITAVSGLVVGIRTSRKASAAAVEVKKINHAVNNVAPGAAPIVERIARIEATVDAHRVETMDRFDRIEHLIRSWPRSA